MNALNFDMKYRLGKKILTAPFSGNCKLRNDMSCSDRYRVMVLPEEDSNN